MFFTQKLTERELHWLIRRSQVSTIIGIPEDVKDKIIRLGYGEPEGLYSFKITRKGQDFLESCAPTRRETAEPRWPRWVEAWL